MNRKSVAIIFGTKPNFERVPFKYFVLGLNRVQAEYEFTFPDCEDGAEGTPTDKKSLYTYFSDLKKVAGISPDYWIVIVASPIEGNVFFTTEGTTTIITTDSWNKHFSPPSIFEYLVHCISAGLVFMHPKLDLSSHEDTRGCLLDYTRLKEDDRIDIALGYICDSDRKHIEAKLGAGYFQAVQSMIDRKWLGSIEIPGSVAYQLKAFFNFSIDRDSGFHKTFRQKAIEKFEDYPLEAAKLATEAVIAILLAFILLKLGLK